MLAVLVFAVVVPSDDRRLGAPVTSSVSPLPPQTASPAIATGTSRPVTPCPEIPMPGYLPFRESNNSSSERMASSQDLVSLKIPDLVVDGQAAELLIRAEASRPTWIINDQRQVGDRAVTLSYISHPSQLRAEWYEPNGTCQYFTATLRAAASNVRALEGELLRIVGSMPLTASMTTPSPSPLAAVASPIPEQEAWERVAALFTTGPVARPTWLPPQIDRRRVILRALEVSPTRVYEIVYLDTSGAPILTFRLGPVDPMRQSGIGFCCVRASTAVLEFMSSLFSDPAGPGTRRMRWEEQTRTLSFSSDRISGEDMLRTAWELDRSTAPPNPYPDVRGKPGVCAAADPETTIRRLLALYGSRDRAAVLDCYSLDRITSGGTGVASGADLPATSGVRVQGRSDIAGRVEIQATWTFTSEPGGAFGRRPTQFFLLGTEGGVWRIYDAGTAPFGRPP